MAEKALWEYLDTLDPKDRIEACTINPAVVVGRSLTKDMGKSNDIIKRMVDGSLPFNAQINIGIVDIEDVSEMHLRAATYPKVDGKRFLLSDYIELSEEVQFRFIASDLFYEGDVGSGGSLVEAALDDFKLEIVNYILQFGDLNFDNNVNVLDVVIVVSIILGDYNPTSEQFDNIDFNYDGLITVQHIVNLSNIIIEN